MDLNILVSVALKHGSLPQIALSHALQGDEDLLVLDPFRGIPMVTPATFMQGAASR